MQLIRVSLILTVLGTITCSGARPTQPTPDGDTPAAPGATFTMTVDSLGSVEAIANVSEVTIDASASAGSGLRFAVAFGDGDTAGTAVVRHVYRTPGTYESQEGTTVEGDVSRTVSGHAGVVSAFSGTVTSDGQVQLRLSGSGETLTGALELPTPDFRQHRVRLTYSGGPYQGKALELYYSDGP